MKITHLAAAAAIAFATTTPAMAAQHFNFQYGCSSIGGGPVGIVARSAMVSCATVTGSFDLDHAGNTLKAGDYGTTFSNGVSVGPISNLNALVSGASAGNGVFGPADFGAATFNTLQDLDLTQDLVGQGTFGMSKFGGDDFNIFATANSNAPVGLFNYNAVTGNGSGDLVQLGSLRAETISAVPEPATWLSMILGMGVIGMVMRRRERGVPSRATA